MRRQESSENEPSSSIVHREEANLIVIDGRNAIYSVAVLPDGKHFMSGDAEGMIQRWRMEDGKEVGTPMSAGSPTLNIAVPRDGKWIVSGTAIGLAVMVWNAESHSKVTEFKLAHRDYVRVVDVSPDTTKIATGSDDKTACVWSLSTGERLLGPLEHDDYVLATKFSPDGRLIATATHERDSVRVYDSRNGRLFVDFPVRVSSFFNAVNRNQSLAWASDSKQLFAISIHGNIHCVDVPTGTTLLKWHIHSGDSPTSIALASNGTFIAASARSSVSFWDTTSQEQIGTVIKYTHEVESMTMSSNYDLVTSGDKRITLRALCGTLPSRYLDNVSVLAQKSLQSQTALFAVADPPHAGNPACS